MLTSRSRAPKGKPSVEIRTAFFRNVGVSLRDADGAEVAVNVRGLWHREGCDFIALDLEGPVQVTFENPTLGEKEEFGPLDDVQIVNSSLWADSSSAAPKLVAEFDLVVELWHLRLQPGPGMPC